MRRYPAILFVIVPILFLSIPVQAEDMLLSSIRADYILVEKSARLMTLFAGERAVRTYRIALGRNPEGPKIKKGDQKTPEGLYNIDARNSESRYHLSLHIC